MFDIILIKDAAVQASLISALGTIVATLIGAVCASIIGKQFASRKKLSEKLNIALNDIAFMLIVEEEHCEEHKSNIDRSNKITMRERARQQGYSWSGKYSLTRISTAKAGLPFRLDADKTQ